MNTPLPLSEGAWQGIVIEAAQRLGWEYHHETNSFGTRAGWPDLALWRPEGFQGKPGRPLILVELKRETGKLTVAQVERINSLVASGSPVFVWKPSDFDDVIAELER
jgi:hypothetical protein